jgi:hypothetical protein
MSLVKIQGNASGTGEFTIAAPNSNTNRTLTLPDSAGTLINTAPGTAGNVLTSNGTDWVSQAASGGGITSGTAVASTSGTSVTFTGLPSSVKRITLMLDGVSWNASVSPLIQLGDSGGLESTGYNAIAGTTYTTSGALTEIYSTGFGIFTGWGAATLFYGSIIFNLLNSSTNTWAVQGAVYIDAGSEYAVTITGTKSLSATLDRISVTSSAAVTFDAGTINILYEG